MGRVRRSIPRSRVPLHRQLLASSDLRRRWLLVAVLGGLTALAVGRSIAGSEEARARWGATRSVLVTEGGIEVGAPLEGRVVVREWPEAVVPADALTELPAGARAAVDLGRGMPVSGQLLQRPGLSSDAGERVRVAVPLGPGSMAFVADEHVDLWSTVDPSLTGAVGSRGVRTTRVARSAPVVADSDGRHVVVAVGTDEAAAVVEALAISTVTPSAVG